MCTCVRLCVYVCVCEGSAGHLHLLYEGLLYDCLGPAVGVYKKQEITVCGWYGCAGLLVAL